MRRSGLWATVWNRGRRRAAWRGDGVRQALVVASFVLVAGAAGCDDSAGSTGCPEDDPRRHSLLVALAEDVMLPTYRELVERAETLEEATADYAESLDDGDRDAAREAWERAMAVQQRVDLMQVGPAGRGDEVAGGEDLRDEIYSWPEASACRVDQETVDETYEDEEALADEPVNVRGFDAIEYLLFYEAPDNQCPPNIAINREGTWADLDDEEITARRARYAETAATLVRKDAERLVQAWEPEGGDFLGAVRASNACGEVFESSQQGLNDVYRALLYLDVVVKDRKLGEPAGLSMECTLEACPEAVESPFAQQSKVHIVDNLRGFQQMFLGGSPDEDDARGFDDLLRELDADDLADDMTEATADAIVATEAIPGTLEEAVENDPEAVQAAYDAVDVLDDFLKMEFVMTTMLELPASGPGDSD